MAWNRKSKASPKEVGDAKAVVDYAMRSDNFTVLSASRDTGLTLARVNHALPLAKHLIKTVSPGWSITWDGVEKHFHAVNKLERNDRATLLGHAQSASTSMARVSEAFDVENATSEDKLFSELMANSQTQLQIIIDHRVNAGIED